MYWNDSGYLLNKNYYSENTMIIEVLTNNHGKCSGLVYGGSSRKIKKNLQIGNKILVSFKSKNVNKIGYFTIELIKAISPEFFDNKEKILCILSASTILKILMPERQINKKIYSSFELLINNLNNRNWILSYIYWEQLIIKELGFDLNLSDLNKLNNKNKIKINNMIFNIPEIFTSNKNLNLSNNQIKEALKFNKQVFIMNLFDGNQLKIPNSRNYLENCFN
jgi:DNA repair protein RecO (recombination protein O)